MKYATFSTVEDNLRAWKSKRLDLLIQDEHKFIGPFKEATLKADKRGPGDWGRK